jgi:hypothetical protein
MTGPAESLIAQLDSQSKLATPRRENLNMKHEIKISKAKNRLHKVQQLQIYRITPKNIPLNLVRLSLSRGISGDH